MHEVARANFFIYELLIHFEVVNGVIAVSEKMIYVGRYILIVLIMLMKFVIQKPVSDKSCQ